MKLVVFGLTISSSWGNGHATLWRGLQRALAERGWQVTFSNAMRAITRKTGTSTRFREASSSSMRNGRISRLARAARWPRPRWRWSPPIARTGSRRPSLCSRHRVPCASFMTSTRR